MRPGGGGDGFGMLIIYSRNVSLALLGNRSILMLSDFHEEPPDVQKSKSKEAFLLEDL